VTVEPLEVDADNNFIETPSPGIITGYVFEDFDNDQVPDAGEGIADVTVSVFTDNDLNGVADPGGFVRDTVTNSSGFYTLTNLVPGSYVIVESQPDGYVSELDIDVSNDNDLVPNTNTMNDTIPATITNGEVDAGNYFIESIACSNVVTNTLDDGPGSLRYVINCVNSGDTITFHPSLHNQAIHLNSTRINIDKDLYIHSDLVAPRIMIYSDVPGAFMISAGRTVEFKNIEITSGLAGMPGAGIENYGHLIIWDVCVFKNPLLPPGEYLIYNTVTGELTVKGACHVQE
jgi:hypothetical protein